MMNLLIGVQSTFDLSKVDFSSGLGINSPDLAGISFLMVIFAGASRGRLHARLGGLKESDVIGKDGLR